MQNPCLQEGRLSLKGLPRSGLIPFKPVPQQQRGRKEARRGVSKQERLVLRAAQSVVTDQAVPEGHKGLHEFLYGEGGAEAHDAEQQSIRAREGEDTGEVRIPIETYLNDRFREKRAGVYAVYGKDESLQYIGFARSIVAAVKGHLTRAGEDKCYYVRTRLNSVKTMATRNQLQADADHWLAELEERPPGNSHELHLWESKGLMQVDKGTFEEKKLKLQKAMGEKMSEVSVENVSDADKREMLKKAVEGDWSQVIDEQTEEALANDQPAQAIDQVPPVSPFVRPDATASNGAAHTSQELTIESADKVLDEVRPYLIADGGNVEVVSTDNGIVKLRLQGACGTCASSSATMKMGLEKALKDAFGDVVKEVTQVDVKDTSTTVAAVNAHLDMLRPAIKSYGGSVEVRSIDDKIARVGYKGPPTIATGIVAAIKGQFPDLVSVELVEA